ncbi:AIR synthase-related protein [Tuber borchii]|uniref:AIR synthase-related protein n=1 Tax=Tuber borchii TaxID=42251 RepID=A0A2T6ZQ96_TUBBO|nr:AIR synthase-related protein [Tuber borchii]
MVIDSSVALGEHNPIRSIHSVSASGLSNSLPELVHDAGLGATFALREVESADKGMSPLEIWGCEAQGRYVMAVSEPGLKTFVAIDERERCWDSKEYPKIIDLPMSTLFGKPPKMHKNVTARV